MPMRWTPDNDQLLLLKILETHQISGMSIGALQCTANLQSQSMPIRSVQRGVGSNPLYLPTRLTPSAATDKGDVPTPRAIKERLGRLRQIAKEDGCGTFSITVSQSKSPATKGPLTPSKISSKRTAQSDHSPLGRSSGLTGPRGGDKPKASAKYDDVVKSIEDKAKPSTTLLHNRGVSKSLPSLISTGLGAKRIKMECDHDSQAMVFEKAEDDYEV